MAKMHPTDIENYKHTDSEEKMYDELQKQLSDDYEVFFSVTWYTTDRRGRRHNSECDFLVFNPNLGYIVIEVKGGANIIPPHERVDKWTIDNGDGTYRTLSRSPFLQAQDSMYYFRDLFKNKFNKEFTGVYGFAVAFPFYTVPKPLANNSADIIIDKSDMENLGGSEGKINSIFLYWKKDRNITQPFTPDQKRRFRKSINERIAKSAAAGALIETREKEFAKIDFVQEGILDLLYNYHQVRILGGAGTGKTFIAMKKAIRDAKSKKKVLFLCSTNAELLDFVKTKVKKQDNGMVEFKTYEDLIVETIGQETYNNAEIDEDGNKQCHDIVEQTSVKTKYDSIIVDEAQDFDLDMGLTVRLYLKNDKMSDLYVFYDVNQNLFIDEPEDAFCIGTVPFLLKYNIRNTGQIYEYAKDETGLGKDTVSNQILGVKPDIRNTKNSPQTKSALSRIINDLKDNYVKNNSIVILADVPFEYSVLAGGTRVGAYKISCNKALEDIDDDEICFKTVSEFKGLEANVVIYLKDDDPSIPKDERYKRNEYVAYTRARYYLYVICMQFAPTSGR